MAKDLFPKVSSTALSVHGAGNPERKEYESLYLRSYKMLERLYEEAPVLYCTVDKNGTILDCNETFAKRLGYTRDELVGTQVFDLAGNGTGPDLLHQIHSIWKKTGFITNREIWLKRKDRTVFPILLNSSTLYDNDGYRNAIACNMAMVDESDIYETRRGVEKTNEELKLKEKLKNEFIAIASHELRTPIQPILGFAILAKKGKINQEEAWEGVLKEARRLQQLANDILDVSRIESSGLVYRMEKIKINELFESVIDSATTNLSKDVSLDLVIGEKDRDMEVEVDRFRMIQVLANVVGNAIKFTENGSIKIQSTAFPEKNRIEIRISDTGCGIPESIFPNLFGKFVTKGTGEENRHGTGLGLFISKAIVAAHNGEIYAQNNGSRGATFTIILPIDQANPVK